jgi:hypothetical protein
MVDVITIANADRFKFSPILDHSINNSSSAGGAYGIRIFGHVDQPTMVIGRILSHRRWHAIESSGPIEILDCPGAPDAVDHPAQDRPEIAIQHVAVDRF